MEKKEPPATQWVRCASSKATQVPVNALLPAHDYVFRVVAENAYGKSEPGAESAQVRTPGPSQRVGPNGEFITMDGTLGTRSGRRFNYTGPHGGDYDSLGICFTVHVILYYCSV